MNELVKRYLACWNETDADDRRALIDDVWAADAAYTDPMTEARGREAIDATIGAVQAQFPGLVFTAVGTADSHHHQTRFSWGLGRPQAEPIVIGFDVAETDEDGRIVNVLGFLVRFRRNDVGVAGGVGARPLPALDQANSGVSAWPHELTVAASGQSLASRIAPSRPACRHLSTAA
jgi:hypothetical protein